MGISPTGSRRTVRLNYLHVDGARLISPNAGRQRHHYNEYDQMCEPMDSELFTSLPSHNGSLDDWFPYRARLCRVHQRYKGCNIDLRTDTTRRDAHA